MDVCECRRSQIGGPHAGRGGSLVCSKCEGFIICDTCRAEGRYTPIVSFARHLIHDRYVCWQHTWVGVAESPGDQDILGIFGA